MTIRFHYPSAAAPAASWQPTKPPRFPLPRRLDYPQQVVGETAGGTVYVQDKGPRRETFELTFDHLPQDERDQAASFFDTVRKAASSFEFVDPEGQTHTVRWVNGFEFSQMVGGRWSGTIQLRKE